MVTAASMTDPTQAPSNGARLVSRDGRALPLRATELAVVAKGGIARTVLTQRFVNEHPEVLNVTYLLPLPADGAVSEFTFSLAGERIVSKVETKKVARERYERAIATGHTAALLEQERTSVFTQKVGNIPPQSEVVCEVVIDQRLIWSGAAEGSWEWRFPTVVGPRYMGEPGRVKDAARITVDVADGPLPTTLAIDVVIGDAVVHDRMPESPSHPIACDRDGSGRTVRLEPTAGARLDRDVIVRWPVSKPEVGVQLASGRPASDEHSGHAYGLLTLVPPEISAGTASVPRDVILLIDTSGSMGGRPLDQTKAILDRVISSLADHDRLEMIEFSSRPHRWKPQPVVATRNGKRAALNWLNDLEAGGGTEMKTGLLEAITPLRDGAQRQVVLVTDGYIGFENEIVETVLARLPKSCRLHTVGVGSAPNRSLLTPVARAGGGVEITLALDEDVERGAQRIVEKTALPLVTELTITGDAVERCMPHVLPDLYAGCPSLLPVEVSPLGGRITVRGRTAEGTFEHHVTMAPLALGEGHQAVAALFAREWVEDLEALRAAGGDVADVDRQVERVGLEFQIATRLTSFVAVSQSRVDRSLRVREETMPHEVPYGASVEGFGLRAPMVRGQLRRTRAGRARVSGLSLEQLLSEAPAASGFGGGQGEAEDDDELGFDEATRSDAVDETADLAASVSFEDVLLDEAPEPMEEVVEAKDATKSGAIPGQAPPRPAMRRSPRPAMERTRAPEKEKKRAVSSPKGDISEERAQAAAPSPESKPDGDKQVADLPAKLEAEAPAPLSKRKAGPSRLAWAAGVSIGVIIILILLWLLFGNATPDSASPPPPTVESTE